MQTLAVTVLKKNNTIFEWGAAGVPSAMRRRKDRREDPLKRHKGFERATKRGSASEPLTDMEKAAEKHRPKVKRGASFQAKSNVRKHKGRSR